MKQEASDELFNLIKFAIDEIHYDLKNKIESNTKLIENINQTVKILTNNINDNLTKQNQEAKNKNLMKFKTEKIKIDKDKDLTEKLEIMCQLIKSMTQKSNNNDVVKSIQINQDILNKLQDSNLKHLEF